MLVKWNSSVERNSSLQIFEAWSSSLEQLEEGCLGVVEMSPSRGHFCLGETLAFCRS